MHAPLQSSVKRKSDEQFYTTSISIFIFEMLYGCQRRKGGRTFDFFDLSIIYRVSKYKSRGLKNIASNTFELEEQQIASQHKMSVCRNSDD